MFLAGEQKHAPLVGPHKSDRSAVVSRIFVLPDESAQPLDGSDDAGSDTDRRCRKNPYPRGRGRDRGYPTRTEERALRDALAVHANWQRSANPGRPIARFDRNHCQNQIGDETRAFR